MAFDRRKYGDFSRLLERAAKSDETEKRCIAENFILEERLPELREDSYEGFIKDPASEHHWFDGHRNYIEENIYIEGSDNPGPESFPETFAAINSANFLDLQQEQQVIRLENGSALARFLGLTENHIMDNLSDYLKDRTDRHNQYIINQLFSTWNRKRDSRPIFAGFWGEVKDLFIDGEGNELNENNWPNRLRDRLGMGHIDPVNGAPVPVLLFRYRLNEVPALESAFRKNAAVPTILDGAVTPYFCPTPANSDYQGQTLDLTPGEMKNVMNCEILHPYIEYRPEHLYRIGWISDRPGKSLEAARALHIDFIGADFKNMDKIGRLEK